MLPVMTALFAFIASFCRSSTSLRLENLALRHQLAVYKQTAPRPRLIRSDRLFWAWLARVWSSWQEALAFVQPRTVLAWQRKRFRDHWRGLSQHVRRYGPRGYRGYQSYKPWLRDEFDLWVLPAFGKDSARTHRQRRGRWR